MTVKVLDYDHGLTPQEHFWDCGPASSQVVLSGRGIGESEQNLINKIGTTVNGTDDISWITPILNQYVGGGYELRYMRNDPPTDIDKRELWAAIRASIDSGFGLVANIVAPPSNYPRGVNGSVSPAYSGGTVYHYIALMGYDDETNAVWVADSGFSPFGYWISFAQLATLIPPKGYTFFNEKRNPEAAKTNVEASSENTPFTNFDGTKVDKATFMRYADDRIIEIHDQLTRRWPQLGNRRVAEALVEILKKVGEA